MFTANTQNDTMTCNSTRPVFPLSINIQSVDPTGFFPVLYVDGQSGKGDGEGDIPSKYNTNKTQYKNKTKKQQGKNENDSDMAPTSTAVSSSTTDPDNIIDNDTKMSVLSDFPAIDKVVLQLYDMFTRDPSPRLQIQIDRYLFAASSAFVDETGGDIETCVLHESQVPSIFNLPDIIYILRQRLVRGSWANSMQETVCRYTIPGMQKSRWVTRQRKPSGLKPASHINEHQSGATSKNTEHGFAGVGLDEADSCLTSIYINTMLGILLGLYPKCSKRPGFTMRVRIVRTVRALLTSPTHVQTAFIFRHVSLVRLALVEYFANVLDLYCPAEYKLLQNHVDVDAYVNLCRSSCDLFRVNNLSEGVQTNQQNEPLDWDKLDQLAYKMTDKIIRSTRVETKLVNYVSVHHKSIKKMVSSDIYKQRASCDEFLSLVKGCAVACWHDDHSYLYQRMLVDANAKNNTGGTSIMDSSLDLNMVVSDVHSVLHTSMLPANFIRAQVETLRKLYEYDTVPLLVVSKKRICIHCLLRIAPKQFVLEEKINGNIRMNLETDDVFCNRCMSGDHIINIDLIGRLLRINQQYLYICVICGALHEWKSDGCDLTRCPLQVREKLKLRCELREDIEVKIAKSTTGKCRTHCFVCSKLCTGHGLRLLHVGSMRMIHFNLCSLHLPPVHMTPYIMDTGDYQRWLFNTTQNGGGSQRKKRRSFR
jgi:hypothetical protein